MIKKASRRSTKDNGCTVLWYKHGLWLVTVEVSPQKALTFVQEAQHTPGNQLQTWEWNHLDLGHHQTFSHQRALLCVDSQPPLQACFIPHTEESKPCIVTLALWHKIRCIQQFLHHKLLPKRKKTTQIMHPTVVKICEKWEWIYLCWRSFSARGSASLSSWIDDFAAFVSTAFFFSVFGFTTAGTCAATETKENLLVATLRVHLTEKLATCYLEKKEKTSDKTGMCTNWRTVS